MPYRIHLTDEARRLARATDDLGTRLLALDGAELREHADALVAVEAVLPDAREGATLSTTHLYSARWSAATGATGPVCEIRGVGGDA